MAGGLQSLAAGLQFDQKSSVSAWD